jgi:uncharacterized protein (TIGR00369 family)
VTGNTDGAARAPDADAALDMADLPDAGAWLQAMGLELTEVTGTRVRGHIEVGPDFRTPWGVTHGGVYATVVETVASVGASAAALARRHYAVGLNNSTDFLRSTTEGRLDIVGEPVIQGRTQQLWQVTITRADGKPVALGRVRLQNVPLPG